MIRANMTVSLRELQRGSLQAAPRWDRYGWAERRPALEAGRTLERGSTYSVAQMRAPHPTRTANSSIATGRLGT